jgi:hypothetical protein
MSTKDQKLVFSTPGGGTAIAGPSTAVTTTSVVAAAPSAIAEKRFSEHDVFAMAAEIERILEGQSSRTVLKVLNMVGSLHRARAIPADRPIGQSTVGRVTTVTREQPKKGQPTPKAAWKDSEIYRSLIRQRELMVNTIKATPPHELSNSSHVEDLRAIEQQLKDLKASHPGNQ